MKKVLIAAEKGKISKQQRDSLYTLVMVKDSMIHMLEKRIVTLDQNIDDYNLIVESYKSEIGALREQIGEHLRMLGEWKKEAKKWKVLTFISSTVGILVTLAALIFR